MIELSRLETPTEKDIHEFQQIIIRRCKHADTWNSPLITPNHVRIFGTRAAAAKAEQRYFSEARRRGTIIIQKTSEDLECAIGSHGSWKQIQNEHIALLDRKIKEPHILHLFQGLVVEMTYNNPGKWTQSQIAIITSLPRQEDIDKFSPIHIMLAPPGVKTIPDEKNISTESLCAHDWKCITVGTAPEREHKVGLSLLAKRKQYGIRPRIADTIHWAMGSTLGKVATSVSDTDPSLRLWEKPQVQVLISRTRTTKDITFVGNPLRTAQILTALLLKKDQYAEYQNHIVQMKTDMQDESAHELSAPFIRQSLIPFRPRDIEIPCENSCFTYVIVSCKDHRTTWIGKTKNLQKRLDQHNSGYGALETSDIRLRPWALVGYITGFHGDDKEMSSFETEWQEARIQRGQNALTPDEVFEQGLRIAARRNRHKQQTGLDAELIGVKLLDFGPT